MFTSAPKTINELQLRMDLLAGQTLGEIAEQLQIAVPENLQVEKGWSGQLIEHFLGATAGNLPEPDFINLGIELKTIPINQQGKALESTFVSVAPLTMDTGMTWRESGVYKKLKHVLWVPIIAEREIPVPLRLVASPFLWQMPENIEALLQQDWNELTDLIAFGHHDKIDAKHGELMQLRPKAANNSVRTQAFDSEGKPTQAPPKGFYLRSKFTNQILQQQFQL